LTNVKSPRTLSSGNQVFQLKLEQKKKWTMQKHTTNIFGEGNSFELKVIWPQIRKANENMTGLVSPTSLATEKSPPIPSTNGHK